VRQELEFSIRWATTFQVLTLDDAKTKERHRTGPFGVQPATARVASCCSRGRCLAGTGRGSVRGYEF